MYILLTGFFLSGLLFQSPASVSAGLIRIQVHPARLMNDFTLVGSEGTALVNTAIIAALGPVPIRVNKVRLSGPTLSAVFTILGFGLFGTTLGPLIAAPGFAAFGKHPKNSWPVVAGIIVACLLFGRHLRVNLNNNGFAGDLTATGSGTQIDLRLGGERFDPEKFTLENKKT